MIGEDYRSQAYNYGIRIVMQEETIMALRGEPAAYKDRHLAVITQLRRETERHNMQLEEKRQEIISLIKVVEGKDATIEQLE